MTRWQNKEPRYYLMEGNQIKEIVTDSMFDDNPKMDIYAGDSEPQKFTFTLKYDNEQEFYVFNNKSYLYQNTNGFKNPEWIINEKKCIVKIELYSTGKTFKKKYKIINENGTDGFRFEEFKK